MHQLKGTGVALVTPFHEDKSIDFDSLGKIIDHCIDGGVEYLVVLGTTGESVVLNREERQQIIHYAAKHINKRVPLVAGFGGGNTQQIISDLQSFDLSEIDAILSSSPNYNKPTQDGIYWHYAAISESTDKPIILYNVPGRTAQNIEASTTLKLANDFSNIIAIKEASCDIEQCMEIIKNKPEDFLFISGDDMHTLPLISFGGQGVISVVAQATPYLFSEMVRQALAGHFDAASQWHYQVFDLIQFLFEENNPGGIKSALHGLGLCKNELRLPLMPVSESLSVQIRSELTSIQKVHSAV